MNGKTFIRAIACSVAVYSIAFANSPALADDDDEEVALLAFLGLNAAQGDAEIEDNGGQLESLILATYMLGSAGQAIAEQATANRVILLDRDDRYDVSNVEIVRNRLNMLANQIEILEMRCDLRPALESTPDLSTQGIMNAIGGLVSTDITYSNIEVTVADTMLVNAVAANGNGRFVLPGEIATTDGVLSQRAGNLNTRLDVIGANDCINGNSNTENKAGYEAAEALHNALTAPGSNQSPSLIEAADLAAGLVDPNAQILRVEVIKAGGSVVERNSLLTLFGADPITISGGLIATYRLIDPATGGVLTSGNVLCRTRARGIGRINGGELRRNGTDLAEAANCVLIQHSG